MEERWLGVIWDTEGFVQEFTNVAQHSTTAVIGGDVKNSKGTPPCKEATNVLCDPREDRERERVRYVASHPGQTLATL